jgi:GNAT superfamily N-acetyltransferase
MEAQIIYQIAETGEDFQIGRKLFEEYAALLQVDLSFQNFSEELASIDQQYHKPSGGLILAFCEGEPAGCAGVRNLAPETAELKRMFVKDKYRGHKIGVSLLQQTIELSKALNYKKLRLDTLENMIRAQALYHSFGFKEIPSYRFNPLAGTIYMEKDLCC